jgi:hypothetical protein
MSLFTALVASFVLLAASPESAPLPVTPGRPVSIRGEVVEVSCFLRDGRRGVGHKSCALTCLKNGGELGIVEDGSGNLYLLAGRSPATNPSQPVIELVAEHVAATGTLYERAGSRILVIDNVERLDP